MGVSLEWAIWLRHEHADCDCTGARPCHTYLAADELVTLLQRGGDIARLACPYCTSVDRIPALRCVTCGTAYWDQEAE